MNHQKVTGLGVLALGLLLFLVIIPVGVDEPSNVEHLALAPQFWPKIIAAIISLMGILLFFRQPGVESEDEAETDEKWTARIPGFVVTFVALFGFYFLTPHLGMVVPGMVLILGMMLFAGERRFLMIVTISLAVPLLLYFFFVHVASIPIPLGIFEALRG